MRWKLYPSKQKKLYTEHTLCSSCGPSNYKKKSIKTLELISIIKPSPLTRENLFNAKIKLRNKKAIKQQKKWLDIRITHITTALRNAQHTWNYVCRINASTPETQKYVAEAQRVLAPIITRLSAVIHESDTKQGASDVQSMHIKLRNWSEKHRLDAYFVPTDSWLVLVDAQDRERLEAAYRGLELIKGRMPRSILIPLGKIGKEPDAAQLAKETAKKEAVQRMNNAEKVWATTHNTLPAVTKAPAPVHMPSLAPSPDSRQHYAQKLRADVMGTNVPVVDKRQREAVAAPSAEEAQRMLDRVLGRIK